MIVQVGQNRVAIVVQSSGFARAQEAITDAAAAQAAAEAAQAAAATSAAASAASAAAAAATLAGAALKANNLSDLASASTARTNLGLGSIATQAASNVAITGGSISGITDLAIADGGTGASTAAAARTALGADLATNVNYTSSGTGALARDISAWVSERAKSVLDFIPSNLRAAILAGTSTTNVTTYLQAALTAHRCVFFPTGRYQIDDKLSLIAGQEITVAPGSVIEQTATEKQIFYALQKDDLVFNLDGSLLIGEGTWSALWTGSAGHLDRAIDLVDCDRFIIRGLHSRDCGLAGIALNGGVGGRILYPRIEGTNGYSTTVPAEANNQMGIYLSAAAPYGAPDDLLIFAPDISGVAQGLLAELPTTGTQPTHGVRVIGGNVHDIPGQHCFYCQFPIQISGTTVANAYLAGVKLQSTSDNNQDLRGFSATGIIGRNLGSSLFEIAQINGTGSITGVKLQGVGYEVAVGVSVTGRACGTADVVIDECNSVASIAGDGVNFDIRAKGSGTDADAFIITATNAKVNVWPDMVEIRRTSGDANSAAFNIASASATVNIYDPKLVAASGSFMKYAITNKTAGSVVNVHGQPTISGFATALLLETEKISYSGWRAMTLAVTASSGTFTTVTNNSARFKVENKTVTLDVDFTLTTLGTASGEMYIALPINALHASSFVGIETDVLGDNITPYVTGANLTRIRCLYNGSSPIGSGRRFSVKGFYEIA